MTAGGSNVAKAWVIRTGRYGERDQWALQAGALAVLPQAVGLDDVLPAVLRDLGPAARR
jgi:hypothetical protein